MLVLLLSFSYVGLRLTYLILYIVPLLLKQEALLV